MRTLAGCAALRHRPRFGQHGLYAQSQHDSKHHRAWWSGLGGPPGRDQGQGGPRPAQRGGDGRRGRPGRRRTPGSASRPLLKIASVSDLMRFVMIVGDSRRRNFELSGLKVRPGARAAGVGWAGAALVVCRARAGDRRGHCARAGSGTDARGFVHEFKSFSLAFFLGGPAVACGVPGFLQPPADDPRTRENARAAAHPRGTARHNANATAHFQTQKRSHTKSFVSHTCRIRSAVMSRAAGGRRARLTRHPT